MAEEDTDILKTIVDAVNGLTDYLRRQMRRSANPEAFGDVELLPEPIELPRHDADPPGPVADEYVVPLPRRPGAPGPDEGCMLPEEVEWGRPATEPSGSIAKITLSPCDKDGTDYSSIADVIVYLRNDRAAQDVDARGWDTDTILSFVRFPEFVTDGGDTVVGVLVGEGLSPDVMVKVSTADTVPGFLRFTADDNQAHHKIIGDSEATAVGAATGHWLQAVIVNDGLEEQLKIEHIGPGPSCCSWSSSCNVTGGDFDELGHMRYIEHYNGVSSACVGPCA